MNIFKVNFRIFLTFAYIISFNSCLNNEPDIEIQVPTDKYCGVCYDPLPDFCPACAETVSWSRYGQWRLGGVGFDGNYSNNYVHIQHDCKWQIFQGNVGGVGGIYQVYPGDCNKGIILTWTYGSFSRFELSEGWTGETEEGIKIGDDLNFFLNKYPDFQHYQSDSLLYYRSIDNFVKVKAKFSNSKKLINLKIFK